MAVITISRQFGAGGRDLGERLAKRIGYRLVDEDMLEQVASKAKVSPEGVLSFEKSGGSKLMKFLDSLISKKFIDRVLSEERGYIDADRYVGVVREVILELHKQGDVIILGRGGQYILQNQPNTLHVLLVADRKHREQFLIEKYRVTERVAAQAIAREDRQRTLFLNCFSTENHDAPLLYDLVINTGRLGMSKTEELIVKLLNV
ncbi:MAG: cytidylate kinase-like family protein [Deltaproteobacteria bacterium]|nr:cytidylate kinase-like family protein [Deltaproteobacteria bacterium]